GVGMRGIQAFGVAQAGSSGAQKIYDGDYIGGFLDILQGVANAKRMFDPCFAEGTLIDDRYGGRPIEQIKKGDKVYAQSEFDPEGGVEEKEVEEVFVNQ